MARFDAWLTQQKTLVDSGAAVEKIVLEGPDGSPWGTWTLRFPNLEESIEGILATLREQLPRGKHPARLIAYAGDGSQVSLLPLTVVGASEQATEAERTQLNLQKSVALMIGNAEKQFDGLTKALEAATHREQLMTEQFSELLSQLSHLEEYSRETMRREAKEAAREERLAQMAEAVKPLISVGADFLGRFGAQWFQNQQALAAEKAREKSKLEANGAAPSAAIAPPAEPVVSSGNGEATSREPVEPCDSGAAASTGELRSDGEVSTAGDGRGAARRNRRKTQKPRPSR